MNLERDWSLILCCILVGIWIRVLYTSGKKN